MNLLARILRSFNLQLHHIQIISSLPFWSLSPFWELRLKLLKLHLILTRIYLSSFFLSFWMWKINLDLASIFSGYECISCKGKFLPDSFKLYIELLMEFCFSVCCSTICWPYMSSNYVAHVGANCKFWVLRKQHHWLIWLLQISCRSIPWLEFQYLHLQYLWKCKIQNIFSCSIFVLHAIFSCKWCFIVITFSKMQSGREICLVIFPIKISNLVINLGLVQTNVVCPILAL